MANILIFPLPELGHIYPTLRLAKHLGDNGHRVFYLTAPQFDYYVRSVGAFLLPLIHQDEGEFFSGSSIWFRFALDRGGTRASRLKGILSSILSTHDFTVVMYDRILATNYRSEIIDITGPERTILFSTSLLNWNQIGSHAAPCTTIVFCPEAFELAPFRGRQFNTVNTECSLRPEDLDGSIETIELPDSPLVLVSFGTQHARYTDLQSCIELIIQVAARLSNYHFAISTGFSPRSERWMQEIQSDNVTIRTHLPQRSLLRRAKALITHGGLGSLKESIYEGVTPIVLPVLHDQPFNAMRVKHHNLGVAIFREHLNCEAIELAIRKAIDGSFSPSLDRMQAVFRSMETDSLSHLMLDSHLAKSARATK